MHYQKNENDTLAQINVWKRNGFTVGFVPTMGALHEGHLSLIRKSKEENDKTVCSIFVNPTQFTEKSDFATYPKTLSSDINLLLKEGVDMLFNPAAKTIYPPDYKTKQYDLAGLDKNLEGHLRPGHFQGVCNVLDRLFKIVPADRAYFGQKDFQQTVVVFHLCKLLGIQTDVVVCPIIREENGLAMSSRNNRLTDELRKNAGFIFSSLIQLKQYFKQGNFKQGIDSFTKNIREHDGANLEYLKIVDMQSLQETDNYEQKSKIALTVVNYHGVRLLDNIRLD